MMKNKVFRKLMAAGLCLIITASMFTMNEIKVKALVTSACSTCGGDGVIEGLDGSVTCTDCDGKGHSHELGASEEFELYDTENHKLYCEACDDYLYFPHNFVNGICVDCDYAPSCDHSGGTPTCSHLAVCTSCGEEYGEYDASVHEYSEAWEKNNATTHKKVALCGHSVAPLTEAHNLVNDTCTVCGYKKSPAKKPVTIVTEECSSVKNNSDNSKTEESTVTVTDIDSNSPVKQVDINAIKCGKPVTVDLTKGSNGEIPVSFVEAISKEPNAVANLKLSDNLLVGISNSTFKGLTATPIEITSLESQLAKQLLGNNIKIPSDRKLVVMQPVAGATMGNTAVIYQFYGPECAGQVVSFYAADASGKFGVLTQSVVFPNGYAAFVVPVVGFVGYAQ